MKTLLCILALSLLMAVAASAADKRGLEPEDFYSEVSVSQVALSPEGDWVAFTVTTVLEEENERHREIWIQRIERGRPSGEPFRFTSPTTESSSPRFSPDGSLMSFSSRRGKDENSIWFIRLAAPGGEAYHIEGVEGAQLWSPDGKWIAFTKRPEDEEEEKEEEGKSGEEEDEEADAPKSKKKKEREGWIAPDSVSKTLDAKRFDGRVITTMRYKRDGTRALVPHRSAREKSQLFVVESSGGEARRLTDAGFDVGGLEWSADSETIFFTGDERQDDEYNEELTSDIFAVAREGGEFRALTENPGSERAPAISPDGKRMAYLWSPERGAETDLLVVEIEADGTFKGPPRNLTEDWDLGPGAPEWTPNGRALRFQSAKTGNRHLFEVSLRDGGVRQVTEGNRTLGGFSASEDGKFMAYTATDAERPGELFLSRGDGGRERRLTHFNDEWLDEIIRMPAERLSWRVADGTKVEGWVIKPVGFETGKKYPMILKIHGGPHSAYGNTWFRTFHVLSASGFVVLYTNPRGSSGYGHKFTYATRGRWGELDREDYLGGVDAAIARYPEIDEQRIGVSGGSYGGFMTNWLTATTARFAAAVTSRSITNWESWYGASDAQRLTEYEFFGPPWEERELYRRLSPITYVENVTAPTLIIHSENDYRTPISDGEQWFMALKKRGVPTELVRYPRSSHGLSRTGEPWLLVDRLERLRSWFAYWLIEKPEGSSSEN